MIKFVKETESSWYAWNTSTHKVAYVHRIYEYNPLGTPKNKYRVDYGMHTMASMIENFQTAKGIAYNLVKES